MGGEEALSLRAVARSVGIATPSIYAHFEDKRALFDAILERRFSELGTALREAASAAESAQRGLRERCLAYCRYALERPGSYRVMFSAVPLDGHRRALAALPGAAVFQDVAAAIDACRESGARVPLPSFDAAVLVWSTLHGLVLLRVGKPGFPWPELDRSIDQLLATVCGVTP